VIYCGKLLPLLGHILPLCLTMSTKKTASLSGSASWTRWPRATRGGCARARRLGAPRPGLVLFDKTRHWGRKFWVGI
jgi:hypothetical protein